MVSATLAPVTPNPSAARSEGAAHSKRGAIPFSACAARMNGYRDRTDTAPARTDSASKPGDGHWF